MLRLFSLLLLVLIGHAGATAQTIATPSSTAPPKTVYTASPVYADGSVGMGIGARGLAIHAMAALGYRWNETSGAGLEWRSIGAGNGYTGSSGTGFGVQYRHQFGSFIGTLAAGKATRGGEHTDGPEEWEFTGKGRYAAGGVVWQTRWGGAFGLQFGQYTVQLDHYDLSTSFEERIYLDTDTERGWTLTLSVGYAFPWRGRR